ncbi:MAG: hypothetical protein JO093_20605 [Acidobacteria bacterium]|nr:hypothetical protein [Acidobacteriota bacterium]MBV9188023.1 hypothetical protein [Acidobacteriota bacterium]
MRPLLLTLAFIAQSAAAATFPPATVPEQAVSGRSFGPAAGNQQTLAIATDGNIGFVVWLDQRRGTSDLYGSRIDANGVSLDPLGILIAPGATGGTVIWSGRQFIAVSERGSEKTFSFLTDGDITGRKTMTLLSTSVAATMGSGTDARILFIGLGKATIVNSDANIVAENVQLGVPSSQSPAAVAAGTNEFLILHTNLGSSRELFADRLDRNGNFLGTSDTGLDLNVIGPTLGLAGGSDGYLLAGRGSSEREILIAHLDVNGVVTSQRTLLTFEPGLRVSLVPAEKLAVLRDGDHYQVTWTTSEPTGDAHTWLVTEPAIGNGVTERQPILDWFGNGYGVTIGKVADQTLVVTDAFRIGVSTNIDAVTTILGKTAHFELATTATQQTTPQVAVAGSGYAVLWNEFGIDGAAHLSLRRFSGSSASAITQITSSVDGRAITGRIAAARGTYVIAWSTSQNASGSASYLVRRMSAATGEWLDPDPVPLTSAFEVVLASNGDSVLATYTVECSFRCARARGIAVDTAAMFRGAETVIPGTNAAYELSMASDGHDFLLAWSDNLCTFPCDASFPTRLLALRLDANGRALDPNPIAIEGQQSSASHNPSAAWTGNSYALAWLGADAIRGRHVSSSGVADEIRNVFPRPSQVRSPFLVAHGSDLFLLFTSQTGDAVSSSAVALDPQTLSATGDATLLVSGQPVNGTISAAALPNGIVTAYERLDSGGGNVGRVFTRIYGEPSRRHAVRR